jgi:uncharacterized RDD family membrane protein YckC
LGGNLLDGLLYGLAAAPAVIVGLVLIIGVGLGDCTTDPFTDELVCNGREKVGPIVAGALVIAAGVLLIMALYLRALAKTGQTWGRRIAGLQVIDARSGAAPGWGKAIGRSLFAYFISGSICYLGYLWMLWDGDKQTWHDKVAGTLVIRV